MNTFIIKDHGKNSESEAMYSLRKNDKLLGEGMSYYQMVRLANSILPNPQDTVIRLSAEGDKYGR